MEHSFNVSIAEEYGVIPAIIINNIMFWSKKNLENKHNIHDGKVWIYNSIEAWSKLFPYISGRQVRTALQKLIDQGVLIQGNYNKAKYDRTKWYAVASEAICQKCQMDLTVESIGFDAEVKPIPVSNPVSNQNNIIKNPASETSEKQKPIDRTKWPIVHVANRDVDTSKYINWKKDEKMFSMYLKFGCALFMETKECVADIEAHFNNLDVVSTLANIHNYYETGGGYAVAKKAKPVSLNWKARLRLGFNMQINRVYFPR